MRPAVLLRFTHDFLIHLTPLFIKESSQFAKVNKRSMNIIQHKLKIFVRSFAVMRFAP